jgi:HPt (histidine-containing phosphotransfer) domain-containing protein
MIIIFIKQTNETIIEIEDSLNNNNFLEVSRLIHKIKPSIEGMGIKSIYKEVKNLETLSKTSKDKNKINNQFISIKEVLIETIKQLQNRI